MTSNARTDMRFIVGITVGGVIRVFSSPATEQDATSKLWRKQYGPNKYGMGHDPWICSQVLVGEADLEQAIENLKALALQNPRFKPYPKDGEDKVFWRKEIEF